MSVTFYDVRPGDPCLIDAQCSVCLEEDVNVENGKAHNALLSWRQWVVCKKLPLQHPIHGTCLAGWISTQLDNVQLATCPTCRSAIVLPWKNRVIIELKLVRRDAYVGAIIGGLVLTPATVLRGPQFAVVAMGSVVGAGIVVGGVGGGLGTVGAIAGVVGALQVVKVVAMQRVEAEGRGMGVAVIAGITGVVVVKVVGVGLGVLAAVTRDGQGPIAGAIEEGVAVGALVVEAVTTVVVISTAVAIGAGTLVAIAVAVGKVAFGIIRRRYSAQ